MKEIDTPIFKNLLLSKISRLFGLAAVLLLLGKDAKAQTRVTGKVTASTSEALSGVSITVKGTRVGTTTDAAGNYAINVANNGVLVFTSIGYDPVEETVNGRTVINVSLTSAIKVQEQVIVVGYGAQRKLDVTGSVGQVKGDDIAKQASQNPISGLQGKVAGVHIVNSGSPGASPTVRIRGVGTVFGANQPLYVVDGSWYDDIGFLNPADIETVNILKDASSEAIYGVRAANGVVLITTKKGKGRAKVNYNGFVGVQKVTNLVEMANGTEYATLINELNVSNGAAAPFANAASFGEATNWFDVVLRPARIHNHHVSVAGSAERVSYNLSIGYLNQDGIIEKHNYERITGRLQNEFNVSSFMKVGYTAILEGSKSKDPPGGVIYKAYTAAPIVPVYYADGTYGDPGDFPIGSATNNPKAQLDFFNQRSKTFRTTGNIFGEVKFLRRLTFRTSFGGEFGQGDVRNYNPVYKANSVQLNTISKLTVTKNETRNWIFENTLTYDKNTGDHKYKILLGQSAQRFRSYFITGTADNVPFRTESDLYIALGPSTTANPRTVNDGGNLFTYQSFFGRVNYSFRNKYLLTASLRADGSSRFPEDERYGYFPSIGLGWVISDESFMRSQKIFNSLKLRGSWGRVGNASVPANLTTVTINQGGGFTAIIGGQPAPGASITTVVPPFILWEEGEGLDIGLEGVVLDNRLNFEIDWYKRTTLNGIFPIQIPGSVGTTSSTITANQADFENKGIELTLGWKDNVGKNFNYNISGNISMNENEVTRVISGDAPVYSGGAAATSGQLSTRTIRGQPIGHFFGLMVNGIFQSQAEITGSAQPTAKPGDFRYVDMDKNNVIDGRDRVVLGNPNPKYTYGLNTYFEWKGLDLQVDLQGIADVEVYNANKGLRFGSENFSKDFFDNRWHGAGTSNDYPSVNLGGGQNYFPNSWYVEDGSYLRIRNIQLGYTLPNTLVSRWKLDRVRFYVNAQNALNFFSYTGFSPEVTGGNPINSGIDNGVYPLSATYNFGVNVSF